MKHANVKIDRRTFVESVLVSVAAAVAPGVVAASAQSPILKPIPSSGERIPVIGLGSSRTFDVSPDPDSIMQLVPVLREFFERGGALVDSSPMYGNAETVIGHLLQALGAKPELFAATKVWTDGRGAGIEQMEHSRRLWGVERFDLIQIHNLRDWKVHLDTLTSWKEEGRIRYLGITTSHGRFHNELQEILKRETFDFVQLSYNIADRTVEKNLLPIAADRGIAVLVNRPYQRGELFRRVNAKPLPDWAKDYEIGSWGQYFLKFAASHPAVTCVIPATSRLAHMKDNMGANFGTLPANSERQRMIQYFESL